MEQHHYQHPGQPYQQERAKRPVWRLVLGVVLLVVAAVMALGTLMGIANGRFAEAENVAELVGMLIGTLCCVGLPLLGGVLLIALPSRRA